MTNEVDNDEIVSANSAEYSSKSDFSKALVVQSCLQKCFEIRSNEMKRGYFNTTTNQKGEEIKTYISDTRKVFISAVNGLKSILSPEIRRDKECKEFLEGAEKKKEEIFKRYRYPEVRIGMNENGKCLIPTGNYYIPEEDAKLLLLLKGAEGPKVSFDIGRWNQRVELYWNEMLSLYDELFSQLNILCDNCNYFKGQSRIG